MLVDARTLEGGTVLEADVCVVGAGAAGITIAREFIGHRPRVFVLESGSLEPEARTQALARGENVGLPYFDLDRARSRLFGGSTNRWAGWCRPLDDIDFRERPWVPCSGWPMERGALDPFYRRAEAVCQLEDRSFEPSDWIEDLPEPYRAPFVDDPIRTVIWKGSPPTKFGVVYRREIQQAPNVTAFLNANVVELEVTEGVRALTRVRVACLGGPEFHVSARIYVLAAGAIETARLLLASSRRQSVGLGNRTGNVGRFFMEHPHLVTGRIILERKDLPSRKPIRALDRGLTGFRRRLALQRPVGGFKCAYGVTETVQAEERILNSSTHLMLGSLLRSRELEAYHSIKLVVSNLRSLPRTLGQLRQGALPADLGTHLKILLRNLHEVAWIAGAEVLRRPRELGLYTQAEQCPDPRSRVWLGDDRDELGIPRVRLEWRLGGIDKVSIRRTLQLLGDRIQRTGIGCLEPEAWLLEDDHSWGPGLQGGHHRLGTARMSRDPKHGVVDENCRVHELENLYISDGSVFATGGCANPLLTIVALSIRLADHLKHRLFTGSVIGSPGRDPLHSG